jgi:hypothetical protein
MITKIVGWAVGLTALFLVLYYYVGTASVSNSIFSGAGTILGRLQGRDNQGNLPAGYPK